MNLSSRFLGSRVAGRLFLIFIFAALLPLAISDWLAATAVTDLAREMQHSSQARATRQVGMQVFERLSGAKAMLATLPDVESALEDGDQLRLPVAAKRVFSRLVHFDAGARANWPAGSDDRLLRDWQAADHGGNDAAPQPLAADPGSVQATLRILGHGDAPPRVLLASTSAGRLAWIGELDPAHLWEPVADAAVDSGWRVVDGRGRTLVTKGEAAVVPAVQPVANASADVLRVRTALFLGAEFGAGGWEFIEQRAAPQARWLGLPLSGWLAMVAIATVLLIALISQRAIRRMLVPLEQLTAGTRLLAAGASSTRVAVRSDDEFGSLGNAFNDMAMRIEAQFGSLTAMSAIDRAVLAGQPIEHLVGRVLDQLTSVYPGLPAAICWRPLSRSDSLRQLVAKPGQPIDTAGVEWPLGADQAAEFAAIDSDRRFAADDPAIADRPWCSPLRSPHTTSLQLLPVGWGQGTQALLVIGLSGQAVDLQPAIELRDRLAVAFSARERERVMLYRAVHDSLTGLANRSGLNEFLDRLLVTQPGGRHAALFVDLDNFKDVNDSLGHEAGDAVLCEAADRLRACVADGALVARQGGDEFVLVLPGVDDASVRATAQRVVDELARPFLVRDEQHRFGASVGVAVYPHDGRERIALLRHADLAMYAAKQAGRGRFEVFADSLEAAAHERLRIPRELRRDMDLGKLVAYFQARVDPFDGRVSSVEALVRWQHPERGLLFPDSFIALAEESSLIEDLGNWMINEACARIALWRTMHPSLRRVSVNVSPRQLASGRLPEVVRDALRRHAIPACCLELEVTESLLVEDNGDTYAQLEEIRAAGVCIALDDFGTGFSSMAMLRKLPIDVMKIDRAFVKDIGADEAALAITRSIAELAHSLGLHLVAEGIETEAQAAMLRELRCHELQGYLYSKPLPPAEFSLLCTARERAAQRLVDGEAEAALSSIS